MATNSKTDYDTSDASSVKLGVYVASIIFNICLIAQVLTVGVAYFTDPAWWNIHVWLVRGYSGLSLILLIGALIAPFSKAIRSLAASLPGIVNLTQRQNNCTDLTSFITPCPCTPDIDSPAK